MRAQFAGNGTNQFYSPERPTASPHDGAMEVMRSRLQQLDVAGAAIERGVSVIEDRAAPHIPLEAEVRYVAAPEASAPESPTANPLFAQGNTMADEARQMLEEIDFGAVA